MFSIAPPAKTATFPMPDPAALNTDRAVASSTCRGLAAKIAPTYEAPNLAAAVASSVRVIPQNLMSGESARVGSVRSLSVTLHSVHPCQTFDFSARIGRCRKKGANQHSIGTAGGNPLYARPVRIPALGDSNDAVGNSRNERLRCPWLDHQALEIPVVHPDDFRSRLERSFQL